MTDWVVSALTGAPPAPVDNAAPTSRRLAAAVASRRRWSGARLIATGVLTAAAIVLARDAWRDIAHISMRDEEASQVLLAPLACLWIMWTRRGRLRDVSPGSGWVGTALVGAGWLLSVVGDWQLWQAVWHAGALLMVLGALFTGLGSTVLRRCLPAVLVLGFVIPVPGRVRQRIAVPMQQYAATVTQDVLEWSGVPLERSGSALVIHGQTINVAEACNGLRMVFSLFLVAYAFAFTQPLGAGTRLLVLACSPLLAIAFNVLRMVPVVWAYGYCSTSFAQTLHDLSGWIMLGLAWLSLLGMLRLWQWVALPTDGRGTTGGRWTTDAAGAAAVANSTDH